MGKVYAVRNGRKTGVFQTWDECQEQIKGFSGAEYKSFKNIEDAFSYLGGTDTSVDKKPIELPKVTDKYTLNIYTDGSFKENQVSLGVYIESLDKDFKFYGLLRGTDYKGSANISGEVFAVLTGVQLAIDMGFTKLNILHDYEGISKWLSGEWTAKSELACMYLDLLNNLTSNNSLEISFTSVKGHSGVKGNLIADKLATRARNLKKYIDTDKILGGNLTVTDVPLCTLF